jgi:hypothetical protein
MEADCNGGLANKACSAAADRLQPPAWSQVAAENGASTGIFAGMADQFDQGGPSTHFCKRPLEVAGTNNQGEGEMLVLLLGVCSHLTPHTPKPGAGM